ncbi:hypothetical protein BSLG_007109 [Batrachochytrium salamandrivorans]|nr:hypothetical protein BASA60_011537 [Batrachochytrium salamandrivorans]KAH6574185.1 hypothetical protein BASA62_002553 [Batrachochytrium salamandrivorans]KAJ1336325.1 hypothetical protein BSLG_007109 [Batrachochytrium salamandrivorans]
MKAIRNAANTTSSLLLHVISSRRMTVFAGTCIGAFQLVVLCAWIIWLLKWENARISQCSLHGNITYECAAHAIAPGLVLIPLTIGWMLWPLYVFFSNFDILLTPNCSLWPYQPVYFDQISQLQRSVIKEIVQGQYQAHRLEAALALATIGHHATTRNPSSMARCDQNHQRPLPYEVQLMVLAILDDEAGKKLNLYLDRLEYKGKEFAPIHDHAGLMNWLRLLAMVMGFNEDPYRIQAHFTVAVGKHRTWVAMFSRDMALLSFSILIRASCVVMLSRCMSS